MCVAVTLLPGANLTEEEIWKMGTANGDGFGMAWVANGMVQWAKSIKWAPALVAATLKRLDKSPRLVHFRLSTVGGTLSSLCHPFEISPKASCQPRGQGYKVLVHNGHFHRWNELFDLLKKEDLLPDRGPWSDTRLIAYLAHNDLEWLDVLANPGRVATLDGEGQLVHLGDWAEYREGMKVSNKHWDSEKPMKQGGYSGWRAWEGWNWEEEDWETYEQRQKEKAKAYLEGRRAEMAKRQELTQGSAGGNESDSSGDSPKNPAQSSTPATGVRYNGHPAGAGERAEGIRKETRGVGEGTTETEGKVRRI